MLGATKKLVIAVASVIALAACSASGDRASVGIGNNLYSSDVPDQLRVQKIYFGYLCAMAEVPHHFDTEDGASRPYCDFTAFGVADWNTVVQAGFNDIDRRCDSYLSWLDNRKRSEAPVLKQLGDTSTRLQAIMRFASSSSLAIDIVAQAFGYAADSITNYNSRLLFEIDTSTVQALVLSRQRELRTGVVNIAFNNKPAVEHALRSYLRICLPFTIETEVNNVVVVFERSGGLPPVPMISAETSAAAVAATGPLTSGQRVTETPERLTLTITPRASKLFASGKFQDRDVDAVQLAFCLAPGEVGPITLGGVSIFEAFMKSSSLVKADGKITDEAEYQMAIRGGPCDPKRFKNIFEIEKLGSPNRVESLLMLLNETVPGTTVATNLGLVNPAARQKIAEANKHFAIKNITGRPGDSDQVTQALYDALGIQ
jgi:hypothetical protein